MLNEAVQEETCIPEPQQETGHYLPYYYNSASSLLPTPSTYYSASWNLPTPPPPSSTMPTSAQGAYSYYYLP